jgi:hypothetical protein
MNKLLGIETDLQAADCAQVSLEELEEFEEDGYGPSLKPMTIDWEFPMSNPLRSQWNQELTEMFVEHFNEVVNGKHDLHLTDDEISGMFCSRLSRLKRRIKKDETLATADGIESTQEAEERVRSHHLRTLGRQRPNTRRRQVRMQWQGCIKRKTLTKILGSSTSREKRLH